MKKLLSIVVAALLVVVACFALTACSNNPKGTYKLDSMTMTEGDQTITFHIGDEIYPGMTLTEDFMVLELKDGDVAIVTEGGESMEGTWKQDGKKITITIENNPMDFTLDGNKLIASFEGQETVLVKK